MGGKKEGNNFSRNTRIVRPKKMGKKSPEKSAKKRLLYSHNNCDQNMGGKNARNIFPVTQELCDQKMLGKKSSGKSAKKCFLYSHEYSTKKMGGKNPRETIFPETHE